MSHIISTPKSTKPSAYSGKSYPLNDLTDRQFEELLYILYSNLKSNSYDKVTLMQGVGERGRDIVLRKGDKVSGIIQCKKIDRNIGETTILEEIVKFSLHSIVDPNLLPNRSNFNYYLAVSKGFSESGINVLDTLNSRLFDDKTLQPIVEKLKIKYKSFADLEYSKTRAELQDILSKIKVSKIIPTDINALINKDSIAQATFFQVRSVVDNSVINTILDALTIDENQAISTFLTKYKKSAYEKLNVVNFFGLDLGVRFKNNKPNDLNLLDVFVKPLFSEKKNEKDEPKDGTIDLNLASINLFRNTKQLKLQKVFTDDQNLVILGDPGAGKSLLVKFIILNILRNSQSETSTLQLLDRIPFRIELRKYAEEKLRHKLNPIQYLAELLSNEYQVPISEALLGKILSGKKTLIFFDGLDEIFDIKLKSEIKESIEVFTELNPLARVVITSRFIGYHDIKLNPEKFREYSICDFNDNQIEDLVSKFYKTQIHAKQKRDDAINHCIIQISDIDKELKSNPLILTLIVILVKSNLEVPESKLEVYEACTSTLVEKRDELEKGIKIPFKNNKRLFANLAYWQYEQVSKKRAITYSKAKAQLASYMLEKGEFEELDEAEIVAEKFLEYAEKRSIYFDNNFTHKTFLEFYTAYYIYIKYDGKGHLKERNKLINKYITNPFWHVVFELLISIIDRNQEDSEVLDTLIESQIGLYPENSNVYYFFLTNMKRLSNISKRIKKRLIKDSIMLCVNGHDKSSYTVNDSTFINRDKGYLFPLLAKMAVSSPFDDLFNSIITEYEEELKGEKELISNFYRFIFEIALLNVRTKTLPVNNYPLIESLVRKDRELFVLYNITATKENNNLVDKILEQVSIFGIESPFINTSFKFKKFAGAGGLFFIFVSRLIRSEPNIAQVEADFNKLFNFGISPEIIVEKFDQRKYGLVSTPSNYERFLKIYFASTNSTLDEVLIRLIKSLEFHKEIYERNRIPRLSSKYLRLDKVLGIKKRKAKPKS